MLDLSLPTIFAAAGADPLALHDQLLAGNPADVSSLASAFATAAKDSELAGELFSQALDYTFAGFDSSADFSGEVSTASSAIGGSPEKLVAIAKTLDGIADALGAHQQKAGALAEHLPHDVTDIATSYWQKVETGLWPPDELAEAAQSARASAITTVKHCATQVQALIDDYEAVLGAAQSTLAEIGYITPDTMDEGPGDIDAPVPQTAAQSVIDVVTEKNPHATPAEIATVAGATAYLTLLNTKTQAGVTLTPAEQAWMTAYYDKLVPYFPQAKQWADTAGCGAPDPTTNVGKMVTEIADGLLILSTAVPFAKLPKSLRDVLASKITTGNNFANVTGTVGLLADYSSDAAAPDTQLAEKLVDSAIRWKQELNALYANSVASEDYVGDFTTTHPDSASSDALLLVSKNEAYSNALVVNDPEVRRTLMGMNWQDGTGAGAILLSASIPSNEVDVSHAAKAAYAIVADASTDYATFAAMSNSTVDKAITAIGIVYIDSFNGNSNHAGPDPMAGPLGPPANLNLPEDVSRSFLTYVVVADPALYADFRQAALETAYLNVSAAMSTPGGDVNQAVGRAGFLMGAVDAAPSAYLLDLAESNASAAEVAQVKEQLAIAQHTSSADARMTVQTEVATGLNVAEAVPQNTIRKVLTNATTPLINAVVALIGADQPAPDASDPATIAAIQNLISHIETTNGAKVETRESVAELIAASAQATGYAIPGLNYGDDALTSDELNDVYNAFSLQRVDDAYDTSTADLSLVIDEDRPTISAPTSAGPASIGDAVGDWGDNGEQNSVYYGSSEAWTNDVDSLNADGDPSTPEPRPVVPAVG